MGFTCAIICLVGWGCADLFYKMSSDEGDNHSHLKIAVWVGIVMGVCAFILLPFSETSFTPGGIVINSIKYFPASLCYILSMVIGYAGLRYLEVSIISPVQNSSGGLAAAAMIIWFAASGRFANIKEEYGFIDIFGTLLCVLGVVLLAVVEKRLDNMKDPELDGKFKLPDVGSKIFLAESQMTADTRKAPVNNLKKNGAKALIFPILYCVFDTIGTAADGIILDEETGLGLGEIDVIVLYGLTFFIMGIIAWLYMLLKEKRPYNPFELKEVRTKGAAALFEEFGQVFYVFAMAENPVLTAPIVASYCIVSVILSRAFLGERLKRPQYVCVFIVICGIVIMGISEGLGA